MNANLLRCPGFLGGLFVGLLSCAIGLCADPPKVTALRPGGLQRGTTTQLETLGKLGQRPVAVWCDRNDLSFTLDPEKDALDATATETAVPGLRWVRFHNTAGASALIPLHVGLLPEVGEREPNNTLSTATEIASLPVTANGVLHKGGEVDTYRVPLRAGEQLIASLDAHETLGSPMDAVLQIVGPDGYVVAQNDDHHGVDPLVAWTAPADVAVAVRVFAFPIEPNSTINFAGGDNFIYRLTLTTGPFLEQGPTAVAEGVATTASVVGWNLPAEGLVPAETPGLHWFLPEPAPDRTVHPEEPRAEAAPLQLLARDATIAGTIGVPGERDRYRFSAAKGDRLRFQVAARSLWSPLDPILSLRDAAGKSLQDADDLSREDLDVDLAWKAPSDGEFEAVVGDRYGHGGERFAYRLALRADEPRVQATVDKGEYTLKPGGELQVSIKIDRQGGYEQELAISVEGLPEQITAAPVTSAAKGNTSKEVQLKLTADNEAMFQGPFRILATPVALAEGESERKPVGPPLTVTMSTRLPARRTAELWLTVAP